MKQAFFRFFLILLPLIPLFLFLTTSKKEQNFSKTKSLFETSCPSLIGVSPLFTNSLTTKTTPPKGFLISEKSFLKQISLMQIYFKQNNIPLKHFFITLPIYLTKDHHWIVSKKSFIISKQLKRSEVSHLNYKKLNLIFDDSFKSKPLTLKKILKTYPTTSLVLKLGGQNEKKILNQLEFLKSHQGLIYLFSSHEKLLKQISKTHPNFLLIHSFKKLVRFQLLNVLKIKPFMSFQGDGILISSPLSPSIHIISHIKNLKKILILEDKSLNEIPETLLKSIDGFTSPDLKSSIEFIEQKKSCFLK